MDTYNRRLSREKSRWILFILSIVFLLLIPLALANFVVSPSTLDFGDDDAEPEEQTDDKQLTFANNFNFNLTNFDFTFALDGDFNGLSFDKSEFTINLPSDLDAASNANVDVQFTIPHGFDAVNEDLEEERFTLGTLAITAEDNSSSTITSDDIAIGLQIKNQLQIKSITMDVDGEEKNVADGSTKEAPSREEVTFTVAFENTFEDVTFEEGDINVLVNVVDISDKDEENGEDLDGDSEDEVVLNFEFDEDDEGTEEVIIELRGEEEHGGIHGEKISFTLKIVEGTDDPPETDPTLQDTDGDGVLDFLDACPDTIPGCSVEVDGCMLDDDQDGLCNDFDEEEDEDDEEETSVTARTQESPRNREREETTQSNGADKEQEKDTNNDDNGSGSIIPFIFGIVVGIVASACFFVLTKV